MGAATSAPTRSPWFRDLHGLSGTVPDMMRRIVPIALTTALVVLAGYGYARTGDTTGPVKGKPDPKPMVLADIRPGYWPESFPTLHDMAFVDMEMQEGMSWLLTAPGEYVDTAIGVTDAFVQAGFPGERLVGGTDTTFVGIGKDGDKVSVRLDVLPTLNVPAGWVMVRVTYVKAPQDVDKVDISKLA